jgi:polyribonucleotide nucleotidyltransferase
MRINPEFIRDVIGKGGETIQGLIAEHNVEISVEDDGLIMITAKNQIDAENTQKAIKAIAYEPEIGDVFENATVKSVMDFGAFVEYLPKKEALVHVSEMADHHVKHPSDVVQEGQKVKVKIIGIDNMGRTKLSMKQA